MSFLSVLSALFSVPASGPGKDPEKSQEEIDDIQINAHRRVHRGVQGLGILLGPYEIVAYIEAEKSRSDQGCHHGTDAQEKENDLTDDQADQTAQENAVESGEKAREEIR